MDSVFLAIAMVLALPAHAADEGVNAAMRHNFQSLMSLQPYLADEARFRSDDSKDEIRRSLGALTSVGRALPEIVKKNRPGLKAIAEIFSEYVASAETNYRAGYKDYARSQLRTVTGFCMACHTRGEMAQEFKDSEDLVMKAKLTPLQKAEYFAATRQFDRALEYYDQVVSQPAADEVAIRDINRVVRSYLNVAVRVKQDPKTAFAFVTKVSGIKGVAEFYEREIAQWKKDLASWMQEKKPAKGRSAAVLVAEAQGLVNRARKSQMYPADHSADISYLRATNALHESLERDPGSSAQQRAEAFYLLGTSYEALNEPLLWDLGPLYYEACIRDWPHSEQSFKCFKRMASSIYIGFSGSGGVNVPDDQLKRLSELRKLAQPR